MYTINVYLVNIIYIYIYIYIYTIEYIILLIVYIYIAHLIARCINSYYCANSIYILYESI